MSTWSVSLSVCRSLSFTPCGRQDTISPAERQLIRCLFIIILHCDLFISIWFFIILLLFFYLLFNFELTLEICDFIFIFFFQVNSIEWFYLKTWITNSNLSHEQENFIKEIQIDRSSVRHEWVQICVVHSHERETGKIPV